MTPHTTYSVASIVAFLADPLPDRRAPTAWYPDASRRGLARTAKTPATDRPIDER